MRSGLSDIRYNPEVEGVRSSPLPNPDNQKSASSYQKPGQGANGQSAGKKRGRAKRRIVWVPAEGWLAFVLLTVALYSVVFSIINAGLVDHSIYLVSSPMLGLLLGFCIAKIPRFPQLILHLAVVLAGYWFSVWLTSMLVYHISWLLLLQTLRTTFMGADAGTNAPIGVSFFFYLTFLGFFLGYFGCWLIYRAHLPWLVALVYSSILLVNISYIHNDNTYLVVIMVASLGLLIARMHLAAQLFQWTRDGLHTDQVWLQGITRRCMQIACLVTIIAVLGSWLLPVFSQPDAGKELWARLSTMWSEGVNGNLSWQNLGSLGTSSQLGTDFFSNQLAVTGDIHLGNAEVLVYRASDGQAHYLEGVTYNRFDGHNWVATNGQVTSNKANGVLLAVDPYATQLETKVKIIQPPGGTKNYLFAPPQPISFDTATKVYSDGMTDNAWTQSGPIAVNEIYQVTSAVQPASSSAYSDVPWPTDNPSTFVNNNSSPYPQLLQDLEVPHDLSPNVVGFARQWTSGAQDAYDGLRMLEDHLRDPKTFTYSVTNPAIPADMDAVDWLLKTHQGYCTHYATTMAVMARLLHIPTRVVGGFSGGQYDQQGQSWVVTNNDAHSWVQAYLPGHGWVNFDPTPGFTLNQSPSAPVAPSSPTVTPTTIPASAHAVPQKVTPKPNPTATQPAGNHKSSAKSTGHARATAQPQNNLNWLWLVGALILLLVALVVCVLAFMRLRRRTAHLTGSSVAVGVFWRVCQLASKFGLAPQSWQTPYEYSAMLSQHLPENQASLWYLTELFVRDRWGRPEQASSEYIDREAERLWPVLHAAISQLFVHKEKA